MKFLLLIATFFSYSFSSGQITIPELENTSADTAFTSDPAIQSLRNKSDLILLYRRVNHTVPKADAMFDFNVLSFERNGNWNYYMMKKVKNKYELIESKVSADTLQQIYQAFIDNDIFAMQTSLEIKDTCYWGLIGGSSYEFRVITATQYKVLDFYMPEFYEAHCPGVPERQKIIKCSKAVFKLKDLL